MEKTKYIFVCGGVMSGIGKGAATASIGKILQSKGFEVTTIKIDPYVNVDAGTMNLLTHGEVFVTEDGDQCDQDMGNYERFLDENLTRDNYMTTGRVYQVVIQRERNLEYGGRCVEVVPDIPNEVISRIKKVAQKTKADFVLIEIGGTVGEYQNMLFLEAARMMKLRYPKDVLFVFLSYVPIPKTIGEMKTKPTQHAVRTLNSAGIQPDIILARAIIPLDEPRKRKISIFCNIAEEDIISAPDIEAIYEIPINFEKENLGNRILKKFGLGPRKSNLKNWERLVKIIKGTQKPVKIGVVEKSFKADATALTDCYLSMVEAIKHASWFYKRRPEIFWLSAENFEKNPQSVKELKNFDGIIVPGGFKNRGVEGKIKAIEFCRIKKIPFLGLCFGMQLAVVEFARNACNLKGANSTEINPKTKYPVIDLMEEQKKLISEKKYGGTMRLGAYSCKIAPKTISFKAYKRYQVTERHRHRYELNNAFRETLEKKGLVMAGINPDMNLVEIIELPTPNLRSKFGGHKNKSWSPKSLRDFGGINHPFFVATQFHPEFKSRPLRPHPLFREFIRTCLLRSQNLVLR